MAFVNDDIVEIWDLDKLLPIKELNITQNRGYASAVSFSNDGDLLVSVSRKVVQVWDIPALPLVTTSDLITEACSHLIANINESEWEVIFPTEEYRPICPNLGTSNN